MYQAHHPSPEAAEGVGRLLEDKADRISGSTGDADPTIPAAANPAEPINNGSHPGSSAERGDITGSLAAGVAHDLNNLLTIVLGGAGFLRATLPANDEALTHVNTIERAVRRAGELCRTLAACTRFDLDAPREEIDLNALTGEIVGLLQTSALAAHRVHTDFAADLPLISGRPAQLRQIILNVLINAAEACGQRGGKVRVSTIVSRLSEKQAHQLTPVSDRPAGPYARLRVTDNGSGMDPAITRKVFAPYFSTKASGRGLGLATVLNFTTALGGGLRLYTESGKGTVFDVFLPLGVAAATSVASPAPRDPARVAVRPASTSRSILLVDDEQILRDSITAFLSAQRWQVHAVNDGTAALEYLEQHPDTGLILLDMTMPRLGGYDTLAAVRKRGLNLPVILMSGNVTPEIEDHFAPLAPAGFLAKPFSLAALVQLLEVLLPAKR